MESKKVKVKIGEYYVNLGTVAVTENAKCK